MKPIYSYWIFDPVEPRNHRTIEPHAVLSCFAILKKLSFESTPRKLGAYSYYVYSVLYVYWAATGLMHIYWPYAVHTRFQLISSSKPLKFKFTLRNSNTTAYFLYRVDTYLHTYLFDIVTEESINSCFLQSG